ncbi:hypothetical protein CSV79_08445 [Sporosarcina sp. P13]|uniref:hypothetical protein n=1 Tax=Sporosarcina sp. P13 TaxID=2048263 RepID=UPI000C16F411|nr:hypothetical protein [Sporosarcina sp. P13]PIC64077.1 hypothetical protein CSV79_08445 [Sporosarcina sp. P13]
MKKEVRNEEVQEEMGLDYMEVGVNQVVACGTVNKIVPFCCVSNVPNGFSLPSTIQRLDTRLAYNQDGLCVDVEECTVSTSICGVSTPIPVFQVRVRGYIPVMFNVAVTTPCGIDNEPPANPPGLPRCTPGESTGSAFICCHDTIFVDNIIFCSASEDEAYAAAETIACNIAANCITIRSFNVLKSSVSSSFTCGNVGNTACTNNVAHFIGSFDLSSLLNVCP